MPPQRSGHMRPGLPLMPLAAPKQISPIASTATGSDSPSPSSSSNSTIPNFTELHPETPTLQLIVNTRVDRVNLTKLNAFHHNLSVGQLEYLDTEPYDHYWMQNLNIPDEVLEYFNSKDKLDMLITHGAVLLNDEIYLTCSDGTEKSARLTKLYGTVVSGKSRKFPHMDVYRNGRVTEVSVVNCTGPTNIFDAFNKLEPKNDLKGHNRGWKELSLRRGVDELGTLYDVRQMFTYKCMLMGGWKAWKARHPGWDNASAPNLGKIYNTFRTQGSRY